MHRPRCATAWQLPLQLLLVAAMVPTMVHAQVAAPASLAADVRASILLKIAGYLPVDAARKKGDQGQEFRIGVLGTDATVKSVQRLLPGKKLDDAVVSVVEVEPGAACEGRAADACDLLYVGTSIDDDTLAKVVAAHAEKPLLIACERPGFAAKGGGIQMFVLERNVRFEVNREALRRQGVRISPQLLKLSKEGPRR